MLAKNIKNAFANTNCKKNRYKTCVILNFWAILKIARKFRGYFKIDRKFWSILK